MNTRFQLDKLSQYKIAIDDGFRCSYFLDKSYFIAIRKKKSKYSFLCFSVGERKELVECLFSIYEDDFVKFEKTIKATLNKFGLVIDSIK